MKEKINNDKSYNNFYWSVFKIALPITFQQIFSSAGTMIDNLMVGKLGMESIAAVGAINRFVVIFWCSIYGITSGGASFIAQFSARKDEKGIQRIVGLTLFFNLLIAAFFTFVSFAYPEYIISFFTKDPLVIEPAKSYLYVLAFGFFINSLVYSYSFNLRATKNGQISLFAVTLGQFINVTFNYLLIYGNHGFPKWGVAGAAAATVLSKVVETIIVLSVTYYKKYVIAGSISTMFSFSTIFFTRFIKVAFPFAIGEILWSAGFAFYHSFFGKISTAAMSGYSMITPFEQVFINIFVGVATAALIMIGEHLGKREDNQAYVYGKKFYSLGVLGASLIGLLVFIFADKIMLIYNLKSSDIEDMQAFHQATTFLKIHGLLLGVRVFNLICFAGILKSGGDSFYLLFTSILSLWLVGIPFAYMTSQIFQMPAYMVYISMYIEELVKAFFVFRRFKSKKWIKNLIDI